MPSLNYDELTTEQQALVKAEGVSAADFNALAELDQQGLIVDSSASDATTGADVAAAAAAAGTPTPTPTPTPGASEPPHPTPTPTPAPTAAPGTEDDPEGADSPEAVAEEKRWRAATPTPTPAPAAAPAPTSAPAPSPAPAPAPAAAAPAPAQGDGSEFLGMTLPAALPPPPQLVGKDDLAKRDTLKKDRDDVFDKFAEGHLSKEEFQAQVKPIDEQLDDINSSVAAQKAMEAQHRAAMLNSWNTMVHHSFEVAKQSGMDYTDAKLSAELDESVRRFGQAASLIHKNKPEPWQSAWALAEAHKEVAAAHGKTFAPKGAAAPPAGAPPPAPAPAHRAAPDLSALPPTTRGAPPAAEAAVAAGEFAHLEGLDQFALEKAVAMMPKEQLDRYLAQ